MKLIAEVKRTQEGYRKYFHVRLAIGRRRFLMEDLETLADAFKRENSNFMRERWLNYIAGECGPNGGAL